jgi:hypothetical protein
MAAATQQPLSAPDSTRRPIRGAADWRKRLRRELQRVGAARASLYIDGPRGIARVHFPSMPVGSTWGSGRLLGCCARSRTVLASRLRSRRWDRPSYGTAAVGQPPIDAPVVVPRLEAPEVRG